MELRKIVWDNKGLVIVLAFTVLSLLVAILWTPTYEHPYAPFVYQKYMEQYNGSYDSATLEHFTRLQEDYAQTIAIEAEMEQKYISQKLTLVEYTEYRRSFIIAEAELETIQYIVQKLTYYEEESGWDKQLFDDTLWSDLLQHNGWSVVAVLVTLYMSIQLWGIEYNNRVLTLLKTSTKGINTVYYVKMLLLFAFVFVSVALQYIVKFGIFWARNGLANGRESAANLVGYSALKDYSMIEYYALDSLQRAFGFAVVALAITVLYIILKNEIAAILFSLVLVLAPQLINSSNAFSYFFTGARLGSMYGETRQHLLWYISYMLQGSLSVVLGRYLIGSRGTHRQPTGIGSKFVKTGN